jgi:cell wall assembly regulator SMI1
MKEMLTALERRLEESAPDLAARLQPPASELQVKQVETWTGLSWPDELTALYRWHDGDLAHHTLGLFGVFYWSSLKNLCEFWTAQADDFDEFGTRGPYSIDDEAQWADFSVRPWTFPPRSWLPIGGWPNLGITLFVDLLPGPKGCVGQLLAYDHHSVYSCTRLADSLSTYLTDLEQGLATGQIVAAQDPETQNWGWRTKDGQPFRARGYVGNVWHAAGRTGFGGVVI